MAAPDGVVHFTPRPLCPRERTPVPIQFEAGWVAEPAWTLYREEKSLAHTGIWTLDRPARSLVITVVSLFRLHHTYSKIILNSTNNRSGGELDSAPTASGSTLSISSANVDTTMRTSVRFGAGNFCNLLLLFVNCCQVQLLTSIKTKQQPLAFYISFHTPILY